MQDLGLAERKEELIILAQELKECETEKASRTGCKHLDDALISWMTATYKDYNVNLYDFASDIAHEYYDKYVEIMRQHRAGQHRP